jgi:transposase
MRYQRYTTDQRQRVLAAAKGGEDWMQVAKHNGVPYTTAWRWVKRARDENDWVPRAESRGGARRVKIKDEHVEYMVSLLEDNCQLTLIDLVDELKLKYDLDVARQTVHRALDAVCFTLKNIHPEPSDMNSTRVRRTYVSKIMQVQAPRRVFCILMNRISISSAQ